ncbi:MerR family transcriptional regulator [Radiobacillus deserti]|uniref:MerR family transcriptional regulator n=1 Tax=Radiobacillus deserti TaxID=2594883 RepID=A0A516KKM0_9BACI|nr:MerR family transcriptional regulator [Radiobacillus deserti]QDP41940.1 MerR family transcriptional regulator [Radiobacillus deserti]
MKDRYSIGAFSKKTSTTIRTLHYYDEIGLLKPSYVSDKGRRFYTNNDFVTLQKILTLKFLGYSLEQIKNLFQMNTWDLKDSLSFQKREMMRKKEQIEHVMKAFDYAIHSLEDYEEVDPSIFISLINNIQMEQEHKEWLKGYLDETVVDEMFNISEEKRLKLEKDWVAFSVKIKKVRGRSPEDEEVQEIIGEMMDSVEELTGDALAFVQEISQKDVEEDTWLIPSPFTKEEEEWIADALSIYLKRRGVEL